MNFQEIIHFPIKKRGFFLIFEQRRIDFLNFLLYNKANTYRRDFNNEKSTGSYACACNGFCFCSM